MKDELLGEGTEVNAGQVAAALVAIVTLGFDVKEMTEEIR